MLESEVRGSRGILTQNDREFLTDSDVRQDLSGSARSQRWRDIRDRVRNALYDFSFLVSMDAEQLNTVLEPEQLETQPLTQLSSAFQFLSYLQDLDDEQLYPDLDQQPAFAEFVEAAETGLERDIAQRKGSIADVTVTVSIDRLQPPEAAMRQLEEGENEAREELRLKSLLQNAGVSTEELASVGSDEG